MEALQKSMEEMLKNFGDMRMEVKTVTTEMQGLRQQIEDFGEDLDGVKRRLNEPAKPATQPRVEIPQANKGATTARLTNNGPPLSTRCRTAPATRVSSLRLHHQRKYATTHIRAISLCDHAVTISLVSQHHWVSSATLHLDGHAALWFQAYKRTHRLVNWDNFVRSVVEEFGQDEFDGQMTRLLQLKQTSTVGEYRLAFEECMYHLISIDGNSRWFVSQFIFGLREDIRLAVRLQGPTSITRAASLAGIQEEETEHHRTRNRPAAPTKHPPSAVTATLTAPPAVRSEWPRKQGNDDFNRERQLRDFRRANNLCFKCGDKFSKEHQCKRLGQLLTIEVGEFGEVLSDDAVVALELLEETSVTATCCQLSLNAVSGTDNGETMKLRALVGNQVMILLIDSGSTHTFITHSFATRAECPISPAASVPVKIANGHIMTSDSQVVGLQWWTQGHTFQTDMRILELGAYDAVLGMDWLKSCGKMSVDWTLKSMEFVHDDKEIRIQGMVSKQQQQLEELSSIQLQKWLAGNDVWAMAILDHVPTAGETSTFTVAPDLQSVLDEYEDVFSEPNSLPPRRQWDHAIALEPGAKPTNTRPYRYSPLQKDEIERQVNEMLAAGIITASMSPFASPVLLVKKKDGSWRFCVDYRRLNELTIKNKFPLPVVDELLDELAGTKFFSKLDLRAGYHQIRMRPEDEAKTAFKTHHGHFQFRVMPFGLTNAPATFQCIMNSVFAPFLRKFVIVFLDDILVYSASWEEHLQHLKLVLEKLKEAQFFAKLSKCSFGQTSIQYLGHIISDQGVATDPDKTLVMEQWPIPTTITELRGFLGLTGYYRKFVKNYGIITKPLTQLLTKKGFQWTEEATAAFLILKKAMTQTPVLALPDFTLPFSVETDACDSGVGAAMGTELHYSTAYHPQTDGQSERVNQCLEQYLRCAVQDNPKRWRRWIPMAEFWYNSSYHTALGCSPFKALYKRDPNFGAMPNLTVPPDSTVHSTALEYQAQNELLRAQLLRAQQRMKSYADKNRTERDFAVGDHVLLKLQPYAQQSVVNRPYPKLSYKFFGPFQILERIGPVAYKLELPAAAQVHPVFHVSQLKPFQANYSPVFSELPVATDLAAVSLVPAAILQRRLVRKGNAATPQVLVQWAHVPLDAATWEDYYVLKQRYPNADLWEDEAKGVLAQGGSSVTPANSEVANESPAQLERDLASEDDTIGQADID
ncbi:hypothetical protein QYE76_064181 [Lolium multiflorum]|uniref:Reverse transcriptase domain-containing protein n=1 Tax=Lolium multiflorum TaxID=4521 RepID=A0AAD8S7Q0_LOLMU|nr:hypothetical protein QYE76_064181 [Lolium multiflorum]